MSINDLPPEIQEILSRYPVDPTIDDSAKPPTFRQAYARCGKIQQDLLDIGWDCYYGPDAVISDVEKQKVYDDHTELPYDFDLLWDIKYQYEVEMICEGKPHSSDVTPEELYEMYIQHELEIPEYLAPFAPLPAKVLHTVWISTCGSWYTYEPIEGGCLKALVEVTDEFLERIRVRTGRPDFGFEKEE